MLKQDPRLDHPSYSNVWWYPGLVMAKFNYRITAAGIQLMTDQGRFHDDPRVNEFFGQTMLDLASPANTFWGNAAALEEARKTYGGSAIRGMTNMWRDVILKPGHLPAMADMSKFEVGGNIGVTPGAVIARDDLFELIKYDPDPDAETVFEIPLLISPPPINRFYILDLEKQRSFVEWLVKAGFTVYLISWRSPEPGDRQYSFFESVTLGINKALDIIGVAVNMVGLCLGGTMAGMAVAFDAATGANRILSLTLLVTLLDFHQDTGILGAMLTPKGVLDVKKKIDKVGVLKGAEMASTFRYLQTTNLVLNPIERQWFFGEDGIDDALLFWNGPKQDTNLSALYHGEYMRKCFVDNDLTGLRMIIEGQTLDLGAYKGDVYAVGAEWDHIVPVRSAVRSAMYLGGSLRMIWAKGGHVGGFLAPPSDKAWFKVCNLDGLKPSDIGGDWKPDTPKVKGSWWEDYTPWLAERSGERIAAPKVEDHGLGRAPGLWVVTLNG